MTSAQRIAACARGDQQTANLNAEECREILRIRDTEENNRQTLTGLHEEKVEVIAELREKLKAAENPEPEPTLVKCLLCGEFHESKQSRYPTALDNVTRPLACPNWKAEPTREDGRFDVFFTVAPRFVDCFNPACGYGTALQTETGFCRCQNCGEHWAGSPSFAAEHLTWNERTGGEFGHLKEQAREVAERQEPYSVALPASIERHLVAAEIHRPSESEAYIECWALIYNGAITDHVEETGFSKIVGEGDWLIERKKDFLAQMQDTDAPERPEDGVATFKAWNFSWFDGQQTFPETGQYDIAPGVEMEMVFTGYEPHPADDPDPEGQAAHVTRMTPPDRTALRSPFEWDGKEDA